MTPFATTRAFIAQKVEADWPQVLLMTEWEGHKGASAARHGVWSIQPGNTTPSAMGGLMVRGTGILTLQIFWPEDDGTALAHRCADKMAEIFDLKQFRTLDQTGKPVDIQFETSGLNLLGVIDRKRRANASVTFRFDHHRS